MSYLLLRDLIEACRRLHAGGLLAASDGNVSIRLPDGRIAMTPSGVPKAIAWSLARPDLTKWRRPLFPVPWR